jgi:integrase
MERIDWFPLERIAELEAAIAERVAAPRTQRDGIGIALGLCGLRVGEVCRAQAKHFQPQLCRLYVQTLKKGVPRTITLHQTVVDAILAYRERAGRTNHRLLLPSRNGTQLVAQKLSAKGADLLRSLGVSFRPRFHMFRHTFAMRLYAETRDIELVQQQLGHSSIQTTMVYARSLASVPESCLVKLVDTPATIMSRSPQLMLFNPYDDGDGSGEPLTA